NRSELSELPFIFVQDNGDLIAQDGAVFGKETADNWTRDTPELIEHYPDGYRLTRVQRPWLISLLFFILGVFDLRTTDPALFDDLEPGDILECRKKRSPARYLIVFQDFVRSDKHGWYLRGTVLHQENKSITM